jgi:hypothetical protein
MKRKSLFISAAFLIILISSCASKDKTPPTIAAITTSAKFLAKSDCANTSLTVTAAITDNTKVKSVEIMYRVGSDQQFTSMPMKSKGQNLYAATIITLEIPGGEYGPVEFSITAEDEAGNQSKSAVDDSAQLLPCVAN